MIKEVKILVIVTLVTFSLFGLAPKVQAGGCDPVDQGCGGGCAENERRTCYCMACWYNALCLFYGDCTCDQDSTCVSSCSPDCSGKTCGDDGCGGSCGSCASGVCNSGNCCTNTAPGAATLSSPADGAQIMKGVAQIMNWSDVTAWGTNCAGNNNRYEICISSNQTSCNLANYVSTGLTSQYSWTPSVGDNYVTWSVRSNNGALTSTSATRSVCVEGGPVISAWSACNAGTHKRTRTCTENCGSDNCAGVSLSEDCLGAVRGTLFDASDYESCPAFDPATGYLTGLPAGAGAPSRSFGFSGTWPPLSAAVTDASGNYSIQVYAPSSYSYDFSPLSDIYVTGGGPKLTCYSSVASVPSNPPSCLTQPCSLVNNMSFGFWRMYGGWWQAVGGSVHGNKGIKSEIPSSLTTEMSLILPDVTMGNRLGLLSYGGARPADMLGTNPNAKVSTSLWEKESQYSGQIYDWGFYNTRFNLFAKTAWDGGAVSYTDTTNGYQIFKSAGSVANFGFSPTGTQKAIFHVNGDVRVTGDIVVPSGAFLAIIAKGTITFDPSVTRADGWYVAKNISVPCKDIDSDGCDKTDSQFLGNGTFVGWNGIALERTRGATNNTAPSEKFTYRQDLYLTAPKPLKIYTKYYKPFVP